MKTLELFVKYIKTSNAYELRQFIVVVVGDYDYVEIMSSDVCEFHNTEICKIVEISKLNCYIEYQKAINKVVLHVF